jgi:PAS domain S-box-containing protein
VRAGETLRYEEEVELPTGRLTVETTLTPVLDDAGRCTHLLGAARDVTARQRAEAAVRENEARFRGVLENLRAPAVCLDAGGRVTFANDALLALTGWARAEVEGDDYFARFVPGGHEARAVFVRTVAAGRADELPARYENEVLTRDGARRLIAWDNAVLRDADGRVVGTASVGQDVTERARAQRLKDQLIATASHELRTPLTAIRGALDLLDGLRPAAGREPREQVLLGMARRNVLRLTRLVNDVLDVDRLEAGQSPLRRAPADVAALLAAAREGVQGVADEAGVRLDVRLAAPGAARLAVDADADRVVQVLTNLVANAVKFSPPGSAITLAAAADPGGAAGAGEGWVRVTVRDEGRGIPADRLEAVFDRFVQVEEADARERGGAGLGLAICRAIVAQHGGRIWAESAGAGRGSAFHFTLPAAPAAAPAAHAAAA